MRGRIFRLACALALGLAGALAADTVRVTGGDGAENGLLVDGTINTTTGPIMRNDDRATGPDGSVISVGDYFDPGEVIAFTEGHVPTLHSPVLWTTGTDAITFAFAPKARIAFKVWVVKGPFTDGRTKAVNACIRNSQIWKTERQGISFSSFSIEDATANVNASKYTAFDCGKASAMKTDIGFDSNAINVYWVDTVNFGSGAGSGNGVWCGGNLIAMGWNTLDHLFSHEAGHAFALEHVNDLTSFFDTTNVMHNASNDRSFLTEGQTFRAVFTATSVINSLGTRSGSTRTCGALSTIPDLLCPAVQKRIWADGASWQPNRPGTPLGVAASPPAALASEVDRQLRDLDPQSLETVETYLRTDCEIGEEGKALAEVRQNLSVLRPYLEAVVAQGPPSSVRVAFDQGLDQAWSRRQEFLQSPDAFELGQAAYELMTAITPSQYLADQDAALDARYRERAALALRANVAEVPALSPLGAVGLAILLALLGLAAIRRRLLPGLIGW